MTILIVQCRGCKLSVSLCTAPVFCTDTKCTKKLYFTQMKRIAIKTIYTCYVTRTIAIIIANTFNENSTHSFCRLADPPPEAVLCDQTRTSGKCIRQRRIETCSPSVNRNSLRPVFLLAAPYRQISDKTNNLPVKYESTYHNDDHYAYSLYCIVIVNHLYNVTSYVVEC